MKPWIVLVLAVSTSFVSFSAGSKNTNIGTLTSVRTENGRITQRSETVSEKNPLPVSLSEIERERAVSIPNAQGINSIVKWISNDAASIGQDVAVNSNGGNPFIGWNLNSPRVSFHNDASNIPVWEFNSDPAVYRNFVALSANAGIIANGSYHNIYLFDKNTGGITFNFSIPTGRIAGPTAVSRDGTFLVCAASSPLQGGMHRVYAFAPPSTTPLWSFDFSDNQSTGVYGINISVDKSTVIVNGKFYAWVLNANNGSLRTEMEINNTESRIAMSGNASVIAIAELTGFIRALAWNSSQNKYISLWQYRIPPGAFTNWGSAVDVSADGLTIMAGTLIFLSAGYDGSIYLFDTFGEGTPKWIVPGVGDEVAQVALSDDGSIAAAATWGDLDNNKPDIYIFERNSNTPVFSVNTPGSMFSLAMSADGKSVVAGGKAVHARQFGSGGNVYNIAVDLGGGAIAGTVLLSGVPPNHSGTTVQVLGTTRMATTSPTGQYVVGNVPAGNYSVRVSHLGYVAQTINNVTVSGTDTTRNVNATLALTGAAPTNLVASHGLNSRIQLNWTNPTLVMSPRERNLAVDDYKVSTSIPLRPVGATLLMKLPESPASQPVPPDSIRIYRSLRTGGPYTAKKTISGSSSYADSSAIPLKDYYYRITALYGQGESVYSNESYGTVDSSFLQFSITTPHKTTTPTIDGTITAGEWTDALKVDVSDVFGLGGGVSLPRGSVFMYFKYDSVAGKLYIAGEDFLNTDGLQESEGFGLYFDDNYNRRFEPVGTDPLLREGNYWAYYFSAGPTVRFREIYTGGGVNAVVDTVTDGQTAFSSSTGHVVGEVSIPISFFNKNHLQVFGPDKKVGAGLFMIGRSGGAAIFHGWWPQTMASVFTPSGFGDIRIPIRLLAPPKAPGSVAVVRQGNFLRVTWNDPTQGLNNDPLTVPVSLQLYRNGTLYRTFGSGVQAFTDSNVIAQGWYEYKMRGSITVSSQTYYGPYSSTAGTFAVSDPQLTELGYDDGVPEVFYVVDFSYNGNKFGIRFTPQQYPARVYRVKAFTNNGSSPIMVSIHSDSLGFPGQMKAGPYIGESHQTAGIDSFLVTLPAGDPPSITSGDFHVVLSYLPSSPGAPGIGGDFSPPVDGRSRFFTNAQGWQPLPNADLIVRAFITGQPVGVNGQPEIPAQFSLDQNYPNPFNPSTKIKFQIASTGTTVLKVFDMLGRDVATLVNKELNPGKYEATLKAGNFSSGVYYYRLESGTFKETKRMVLLK